MKIQKYSLLELLADPELADGLIAFDKSSGTFKALDINGIVDLLEIAGGSFTTGAQVVAALAVLAGNDRLSYLSLKETPDLSLYLLKSQISADLDWGTDSTAWDCENGLLIYAKAAITADLTPVFSNHEDGANKLISRERTYIWTVNGTCNIDLPKHFFKEADLPDGVAWDDATKLLTITDAANTRYVVWCTLDKVADELICNIQEK